MAKLTVSEGLQLAKKLKGRHAELLGRARQAVCFREDQKPAYEFDPMKAEMDKVSSKLVEVQTAMAVANATTSCTHGERTEPLSYWVRSLQEMKGQISFYKDLTLRSDTEERRESVWDEADGKNKMVLTKKQWKSAITEPARDEQVSSLQDKYEKLNNFVNKMNHRTEINVEA